MAVKTERFNQFALNLVERWYMGKGRNRFWW